MGYPGAAMQPKFATLDGRLQHQDELDACIEQWTLGLDKYTLTETCQAAGICALPVQSSQDRLQHDPQLRYREQYRSMPHPMLGEHALQNAPFKLSRTPARNTSAGPLIGEHTLEVAQELLNLTREQVIDGFTDGTFWPSERERMPYMDAYLAPQQEPST